MQMYIFLYVCIYVYIIATIVRTKDKDMCQRQDTSFLKNSTTYERGQDLRSCMMAHGNNSKQKPHLVRDSRTNVFPHGIQ